MKILYNSTLLDKLAGAHVFLDTNIFIAAINFPECLGLLLQGLKQTDCIFLTVPPVVFEFSRGATETKRDFEERISYATSLAPAYPIDKHLNSLQDFILVLSRANKRMSYTDFLLCACLYFFKAHKTFLITENYKDIPLSLFDRVELISLDSDVEIRNYGVYTFSDYKYQQAAKSILATL